MPSGQVLLLPMKVMVGGATFDISVEGINFIFNDGKASGSVQTDDLYTEESKCYGINQETGMASEIDCDGTALPQVQEEKTFTLYPNPVENEVNVTAKNTIDEIRIYSATGQLVGQETIHATRATVDVDHLQKGIYFIQARMGNRLGNNRFIKK